MSWLVGRKSSKSAGLMGIEGYVRFLVYVCSGFLVGKVAKVARLMLVESQFYVSFIFADGFLEGRVAKVEHITGVEVCDHCLKFIFVYVL